MFPFYERLREIKRQGVAITIIAPKANNRRFFDTYVRWECVRSGFDLRLYEGRMTHLKAMLIVVKEDLRNSTTFDDRIANRTGYTSAFILEFIGKVSVGLSNLG